MSGAVPALLPVEIGLTAAIVAMQAGEPMILAAAGEAEPVALPSGPFDPLEHRTFEIGLRASVARQTGTKLGYVEQLYTFGDRGRHARDGDRDPHVVSVGYLALARLEIPGSREQRPGPGFLPWYQFFPWEDWRGGRPALLIDQKIAPLLQQWAGGEKLRTERINRLFAAGSQGNDAENVLERYELLYEAGLVEEARRDGRPAALARAALPQLGRPMRFDHRRILATAMGRLRAKMKYRPVIFELMPESFTLTALQGAVEAISGRLLHKQNFRRLVDSSNVAEPVTGASAATGGRPAALFRFRREMAPERRGAGLRAGIRAQPPF